MVEDCDFGRVFWIDYWKVGENEIKARGDIIVVLPKPCMLCTIGPFTDVDEIAVLHDFLYQASCPSFCNMFTGGISGTENRVEISSHKEVVCLKSILQFI